LSYALLLPLLVAACDEDGTEPGETATFDVLIENVSQTYEFSATGVFNTPVGANDPGVITPGQAYEFSFSAAPGAKLSFATMFVHSNDFFYAPEEQGIDLFDDMGMPISGDVTAQVQLWDAGTEENQEPGVGNDQAPRQSGPDTGADDPDSDIRAASDDFGNLPAVTDVIRVTVTPDGDTRFTARIENVSNASTLMTSQGNVAVPLSPGVWVVHSGDAPLFDAGQADLDEGLEALAEDGDPSGLGAELESRTGLSVPLSPGVWAVHSTDAPLFDVGQPDRGEGLEPLAEDGDPSSLGAAVASRDGVESAGVFNTPDGAGAPGVILPGQSYSFSVTAAAGTRLSLATMFVQSNDLFYAPDEMGIALFDGAGNAVSGDMTSMLALWDAGTEVNEEPGIGLNQAPRQSGPDTGDGEGGNVRQVNDAYSYPDVDQVIRVTVTPSM
jgi:hypothetical protein